MSRTDIDIFGNLEHESFPRAISAPISLESTFTNPLASPNNMWSDSVYPAESGPLSDGNHAQNRTVGRFEKTGTLSSANSVNR